MTNVEEILTDRRGLCAHCGHRSTFTRRTTFHVEPKWRDMSEFGTPVPDERVEITPYSCQGCLNVSLIAEQTTETHVEMWLLYPTEDARDVDQSVPDSVASLFSEASLVESAGAMRAAGVMYRAAAEAICVEQGATGSDLKKKIAALKHVSPDIADHLDQARILGNTSIHSAIEYSADEVEDVAELLLEVLEVVYVQPAKRAAMAAARAQRAAAGTAVPAQP